MGPPKNAVEMHTSKGAKIRETVSGKVLNGKLGSKGGKIRKALPGRLRKKLANDRKKVVTGT